MMKVVEGHKYVVDWHGAKRHVIVKAVRRVNRDDGPSLENRRGAAAEARPAGEGSLEAYCHPVEADSRLDEWLKLDLFCSPVDTDVFEKGSDSSAPQAGPLLSNPASDVRAGQKRKRERDSHSPVPSTLIPSGADNPTTALQPRRISTVIFGSYEIKCWYSSPYPLDDILKDAAAAEKASSSTTNIPAARKTASARPAPATANTAYASASSIGSSSPAPQPRFQATASAPIARSLSNSPLKQSQPHSDGLTANIPTPTQTALHTMDARLPPGGMPIAAQPAAASPTYENTNRIVPMADGRPSSVAVDSHQQARFTNGTPNTTLSYVETTSNNPLRLKGGAANSMPTLPGFANLNGNADDLTTTKQGPDATAYADDENGAYTSSETEDEEPQQQPAGLASTSMPISNQAAIMPLPIHAPSQAPIPGASMRDPAHERKDSATSPDKKYSTETAETGVVASTSARKDGKDKSIQPLLLYVCEGCFKYFIHMPVYSFHLKQCKVNHPPGRKVYQRGAHTIWEVDGATAKLFCQNLCLFGKLFIDHKYVFFEPSGFVFYILSEARPSFDHVLGFFSKEKISYNDYNLACIVTFPPYQKRGFGTLMIEFSYELSSRAESHRAGTPERPLSDLGLRSYLQYWTSILVRYFRLVFIARNDPRLVISARTKNKDASTPKKKPEERKKKNWKGFEGEVEPEKSPISVLQPNSDEELFAPYSHFSMQFSLAEIAHATHLRDDDVAFALLYSGLAKYRMPVGTEYNASDSSNYDGEMEIVITPALVEAIAKKFKIKLPVMSRVHCII